MTAWSRVFRTCSFPERCAQSDFFPNFSPTTPIRTGAGTASTSMTPSQRFDQVMEGFRAERENLLESIRSMDQRQLDFQPSRLEWSAGEVVHHVMLAEKLWQGYIRELLDGADPRRGARREISAQELSFQSPLIPDVILQSPWVLGPMSVMVNFIPKTVQSTLFAVPLIKLKAGPRLQPKRGLSPATLLELSDQVRLATLEMLAPVKTWDLSRFCVNHPFIGEQNVYGILELVASHDQRHKLQIENIQKDSAFPR